MRISVQLRAAATRRRSAGSDRSTSDEVNRERTVFFDDLTPVGATTRRSPPLGQIRSVMFVVDTTNTKPGASGRIWIKAAALER